MSDILLLPAIFYPGRRRGFLFWVFGYEGGSQVYYLRGGVKAFSGLEIIDLGLWGVRSLLADSF